MADTFWCPLQPQSEFSGDSRVQAVVDQSGWQLQFARLDAPILMFLVVGGGSGDIEWNGDSVDVTMLKSKAVEVSHTSPVGLSVGPKVVPSQVRNKPEHQTPTITNHHYKLLGDQICLFEDHYLNL